MKTIISLLLILQTTISYGLVYTVTDTSDSGLGSLRTMITTANLTAGNTIIFNIPTTDAGYGIETTGVFTIKPLTNLPAITSSNTYINAMTQVIYTGDTNPDGLEIEVTGVLIDTTSIEATGFYVTGQSVIIEGICISSFNAYAIQTNTGGGLSTVDNCYIGTDATGMKPKRCAYKPSGYIAVFLGTQGSTIKNSIVCNGVGDGIKTAWFDTSTVNCYVGVNRLGTGTMGNFTGVDCTGGGTSSHTVSGCLISGNSGSGILVSNNLCTITNNKIGTDITGNNNLANNDIAVSVTSTSNTITGNTIKFNTSPGTNAGIVVDGGVCNLISRNVINQNKGAEISLINSGNFFDGRPFISSVTTVVVSGTSTPNAILELYVTSGSSVESGTRGRGGSSMYVGSTTANGSGNWSLTYWSPYSNYIVANDSMTVISHKPNNNTSTFGINQLIFPQYPPTPPVTTMIPYKPQVIIY